MNALDRLYRAALESVPGGTALGVLRVEIGETTIDAMAIDTPTCVVIPIDARLPNGGFLRARVEIDHAHYQKAIEQARRLGGVPVLAGLLQRCVSASNRPLLPR